MEYLGFNNIYKNKKVLITGHTGFKGSWLVTWLDMMGAKVVGISEKNTYTTFSFRIIKNTG